jgi:hypothetical protein
MSVLQSRSRQRIGRRCWATPAVAVIIGLVGACHGDSPSTTAPTADIGGTWERYPEDWFGEDPDHPPPPGGAFDLKEPYASAYKALQEKKAAADAAGAPIVNASTRCLPEGMPTIMAAIYPIQILQNPGQVTVLAEFLTQTRRIWLDEQMPPLDSLSPSYNGYSVGHWQGDTLVVETTGIRTDALFFDVPHTENMRITERIRRTAPDRLENAVVIEDPQILNQPYRFTFEYKQSSYKIMEYNCDDNQIIVDDQGKTHLKLESAEH